MAEIIQFKNHKKQRPKPTQPQLTCHPVYHPEIDDPIVTNLEDLGTAIAICVTVTGDNGMSEKLISISRRAVYDEDKDSWVELTIEESRQFADLFKSLEPDRYTRLKLLMQKVKYAHLEDDEEYAEWYKNTYSHLTENL